MGQVSEYTQKWKGHGDYFCVSDHGMLAAVPHMVRHCEASGKKDDPHKNKKLNPIYAVELYVNPLQIEYDEEEELQQYIKSLNPIELKLMRRRGFHLLAIAINQIGYSNLVRLCSLGWTKGFYYRPRVNHEQLRKYKEGIVFSSCCFAGEVAQAFSNDGVDAGHTMIEKYIEMFGKENFYLEIILLDFEKQKPFNAFIVKAADKYGLKIFCSGDVHYCNAEDSQYQRLMLMVQTKNTVAEIQRKLAEDNLQDMFEMQDQNLWMKTEEELNDKWQKDYQDIIPYDVFKQSKLNTIEICRRAGGVELDRSSKLPQITDANLKLKEEMLKGFKYLGLPMEKRYLDRLKEEYELICHKDFASYFLIQKMITDEARRVCVELLGWGDGWDALAPARGSSAASLICYCLKITEVDPIKHDLLFSRFLSPARGGKSLRLRFKNIDPLSMEEVA